MNKKTKINIYEKTPKAWDFDHLPICSVIYFSLKRILMFTYVYLSIFIRISTEKKQKTKQLFEVMFFFFK